jgi:NAD(P) transhydrogenase subunit alpha
VTILGYTDLTSRMARHTSQLFGTNVVNLLTLLTPGKDGALALDLDDPVQRGMAVTRAGEVLWPPPPVQVSAAPAAEAAPVVAVDPVERARAAREAARLKGRRQMVGLALGAVLLALAITFSPAAFLGHFTVFVLAVFVGYYVISNVSHSLHTPLMAQTNAISGIILVGALLQIGSADTVVTVLAVAAAAVASINIFGGFHVAFRMIGMFRKEEA